MRVFNVMSSSLVNFGYLLLIISGIVQGSEDCNCSNSGIGSTVNCEIANQACLDQVVAPFLQHALGTISYGLLRLACNEDEPIVFPKDLVKDATFSSLLMLCGSSVIEPGTLGIVEHTLTEATIRLRQIPALQASRMLKLHFHGPNNITITRETFAGYHNLQNIEFWENVIIESVEFGSFSSLTNLQSLVSSQRDTVIHELGPGSLYFNPSSLKRITLGPVDKIYPGAIAGIPKGVELEILELRSSDLSIEVFGGLLYGGSHLKVPVPLEKCRCSAAWIVRDTSSMALNAERAANVRCLDQQYGPGGPPWLWTMSADDFTTCN